MDVKKMKEILAKNSQTKSKKIDTKNIYWKPPVGKKTIRVIPSAFNPDNPFTELKVNYALNKSLLSLETFGEKDPIVEFAKSLRKTNDKDSWKSAKQLDHKTRIFLPVIVRGEENEGVKLWQFGKEVYMKFLNFADNEDIGDFTDIINGRDFEIITVGPESTGTQYNKSDVQPKMKTSPLSEDAVLVEKWLKDQPNPIEQFKRYTFEEIKQMLQDWLGGEDEEDEEEPVKEHSNIKNLFKDDE